MSAQPIKVKTRRPYIPRLGAPLGECELEAVRGLANGLAIKSIAGKRGISTRTVEYQLSCCRIKTGCKTNAQMTAWAVRKGLL